MTRHRSEPKCPFQSGESNNHLLPDPEGAATADRGWVAAAASGPCICPEGQSPEGEKNGAVCRPGLTIDLLQTASCPHGSRAANFYNNCAFSGGSEVRRYGF